MNKTRILIVEDDKLLSTTFQLFVSELGHEIIGVTSSGEEAINMFREKNADLVLMDIHLPGEIDGISAALAILKIKEIPVIYVTSDKEKETVKRALASNSYGYLLKPLSKVALGIAIEQALLKFKFNKEIEIKESRYRKLVEDSPDAILVVNENHEIEYINKSGIALFGTIHIENIINSKIENFFKKEQAEILRKKINDSLSSLKHIDYFPLNFKSLNDNEFLIGISGSVVEFNGKKMLQLIATDHTRRISAENVIRNQYDIINKINDGIIVLDRNGVINLWNKGAEKIFGIESKIALNQEISFVFDDAPDFFLNKCCKPLIEKKTDEIEFNTINKSTNKPVHVKLALSPLLSESETGGVICYCKEVQSISEVEAQLYKITSDFNSVFNGNSEAMIIINSEKKIINNNKLAVQYAKNILNKELNKGISAIDFLYFFNRSELIDLLNNTFEGVAHFLERFCILRKQEKYLKINIFPIFDKDDVINRLCISLYDITDRKRIERDLDETRNELKPLFDSSIQRFYLVDLNYNLLAFNKAAQDIIQKDFNRTLRKGDNIIEFIPSEMHAEEFRKYFEETKRGNHVVFKQKIKSGGGIEYNEAHLEPIISEKGEIQRILLWTLDVSETEKNLQALKESEERYALVAKGGNDGLWDWNMETDEVYFSPRWKIMLGFDEEDDVSRDDAKDLLVHRDDIEMTKEKLSNHLKGKTDIYINEYRLRHKNGNYLWVLERGLALFDEKGKPYRMAGTISDITERKKHEEEIRQINKALLEERSMFLKGKVVVFRVNPNNFKDVAYMSENVEDVLGYTVEDFAKGVIDFANIVHPEDREMHKKERDLALTQKANHVEFSVYRIIKKNQELVFVKDFITIIRNKEGEPVEFLGYFIDVTKEKLAEIEISENQQKYYTLFSEANDAILMIQGEKIIDCNSMAENIFGYTKNELLNLNILLLSPEKQPSGTISTEKRERKIAAAFEGEQDTFYWQYKKKSGELFDAEVSLSVFSLNQKKFLHAIIRDISDRKKIEKELRTSKEKYIKLLDAMPDMIFIIDKSGKYIDYKPDKITGLEVDPKKIIGKSLGDFFTDEKKYEFQQKIEKSILTGTVETIRYNLDSPKGMRNFEARISKLAENESFVQVRDFTDNLI